MRDQAFRNLLLGYNLIYGIVLAMMLMLLLTGRNMGQGASVFVIIVVTIVVAPAVAVNVGCLKRQSWGAWVALIQSLIYVLFGLISFMTPSAPVKGKSAEFEAGRSGGAACMFLAQVLLAALAWRAVRAPRDDTAPITRNSSDSAVEILALAYASDGQNRPEALQLVLRTADQLVGPVSMNPAFKARIQRIANMPDSEARLAHAVGVVGTSFDPQQKQWLLESARAICSVGGPPDPLAEEFLKDLQSRLLAHGRHEPFGRAQV